MKKRNALLIITLTAITLFNCRNNKENQNLYKEAIRAYAENDMVFARNASARLPETKKEYLLLKAGITFTDKNYNGCIRLLNKLKKTEIKGYSSYLLIRSLINTGKILEAEETITKQLNDNPGDFRLLSLFGDLKMIQQDFSSALFLYSKASESSTDLAACFYKMAKIYLIHGQQEKAVKLMKNAQSITESPEILNEIANLLKKNTGEHYEQ